VTRNEVLARFARDDDAQLRAVLRDLVDTGLVALVGTGAKARYRGATEEELSMLRSPGNADGLDDLLVALMYREGPLTLSEIAARAQVEASVVDAPVARLVAGGRVQVRNDGGEPRYQAGALVIPLGSSVGWEGAVLDHFKALVSTVLVKLRAGESATSEDQVGGSTYTIDVWSGHPLEQEVLGTLSRFRAEMSELRRRAELQNQSQKRPRKYSRVVVYGGQCVIPEEE
jgi:hypothetical protein